jgi:hypothetical protein
MDCRNVQQEVEVGSNNNRDQSEETHNQTNCEPCLKDLNSVAKTQ